MKKIILFIVSIIIILIIILIINTLTFSSKQVTIAPANDIPVDDFVITNLSEAVQFKTVSYDNDSMFDSSAFNNLIQYIDEKFPLCKNKLKQHTVGAFNLVYEWEGSNKDLKPVIFLAHTDVVPAIGEWQESPFSGKIKDQFIWGRGTLDDKVSVLGILEASEKLLQQNYTPKHSIFFAFGHDEEIWGKNGAIKIAEWMKKENIQVEFILDEGLVITEGIVPGLEQPAALIGIAEKGVLTLKLSSDIKGGHASMPEKETAIGVISEAITELQNNPFEARLTKPAAEFLNYIGPEMPFLKRIVFANSWLFKGAVISQYEKSPSGNALVRTTIAPVIFKSGIKENVLPKTAEAIINIRPLPEQKNSEVIDKIKEIINDGRVKIEVITSLEPSGISSSESQGFSVIEKTIRQIFPDALVAPSLMIAGTDSKHYAGIAENTYRFLPIRLKKEDIARIHGANERISVKGYKDVIRFYFQLIKNL